MKRTLLIAAALIALTTAAGCYSHTYRTGARPAQQEADYVTWQHNLIAGLVNLSGDVDLNEICPQGAAVIHNRLTIVNILVSAITSTIYTPTTVKVWCAEGGAAVSMHEVEMNVTPELIEQASLIIPDLEDQLLAMQAELTAERLAAGSGTILF